MDLVEWIYPLPQALELQGQIRPRRSLILLEKNYQIGRSFLAVPLDGWPRGLGGWVVVSLIILGWGRIGLGGLFSSLYTEVTATSLCSGRGWRQDTTKVA